MFHWGKNIWLQESEVQLKEFTYDMKEKFTEFWTSVFFTLFLYTFKSAMGIKFCIQSCTEIQNFFKFCSLRDDQEILSIAKYRFHEDRKWLVAVKCKRMQAVK